MVPFAVVLVTRSVPSVPRDAQDASRKNIRGFSRLYLADTEGFYPGTRFANHHY